MPTTMISMAMRERGQDRTKPKPETRASANPWQGI